MFRCVAVTYVLHTVHCVHPCPNFLHEHLHVQSLIWTSEKVTRPSLFILGHMC